MLLEFIEGEAAVALWIAIFTMVTFCLWMHNHRDK